ncbi:conjugal transfer protein TrbF [Caulobacter rhizosphaerae]|jgi:type IV secretion system protein VirB5|uniref:conjugal transfer protein TrbF n=1 Tax=Caulobacter rhizosphaerae TaxID=2010972 RepID=UPI0013D088B0|nr:conjugal transfer protein TrbF [Caulobacter rhizosphaerae]GGL09741.1 conjugal transfer protein TrbF [Caulobacter rhizosphaerae]
MNPFKGPARLGATPVPETPYQRAGQAWDERIGSARVQAANWRLIALGLLASNIVQSGGMIWQAARGSVTPWVVEVDRLGQTLAIGPAQRGYRPPDAVIAWTLSRFIENTRAVPADAVVLGQNWRRAYDFVDAAGAAALSEYARVADPFAQVGRSQVSVEVTNVVRASPDSFRLAWIERRYVDGQLVSTQRWSAILTLVIVAPTSPEAFVKNPFGIFVRAVSWSREYGA